MAQQRLGLGGEAEVTARLGHEEGSHAEAIPREEQLPPVAVPDRERELAVEALQTCRPPLLVGMDEDLGVAGRPEHVTELAQLDPELQVVVDLAVLHPPVPAAFISDRLVAVGQVDDGEPRVDHPEAVVEVQPDTVRPSMGEIAGHVQEQAACGSVARSRIGSADPTHR